MAGVTGHGMSKLRDSRPAKSAKAKQWQVFMSFGSIVLQRQNYLQAQDFGPSIKAGKLETPSCCNKSADFAVLSKLGYRYSCR